ncbi:MAG: hypothetical protein ACKVG9_00035 [Rhodospirillales bacterium]
MAELISFLMSDQFGSYVMAFAGLVTAANAITVLTPTQSDDKVINVILMVLNAVSGNFGRNANADDK